jgi:ABC-type nickel/cobalt efflux system permease component RcnA
VPGAVPSLLLLTAAATAAFHTLIPDHWLPFVLVGRARGWSARTTAAVSGFSAVVHTSLSVALGFLALRLGRTAAAAIGERLERGSGILLVVFGAVYALWAWRKGGHFHPGGALFHAADEKDRCDGDEGSVASEHLHYHADGAWIAEDAGKGAIPLALIVGLNPCILVLPVMVATAEAGAGTLALVTAAYALTTVALMVGFSVAGVSGARRLPFPAAARHMETASGVLIALCGAAFLLIER